MDDQQQFWIKKHVSICCFLWFSLLSSLFFLGRSFCFHDWQPWVQKTRGYLISPLSKSGSLSAKKSLLERSRWSYCKFTTKNIHWYLTICVCIFFVFFPVFACLLLLLLLLLKPVPWWVFEVFTSNKKDLAEAQQEVRYSGNVPFDGIAGVVVPLRRRWWFHGFHHCCRINCNLQFWNLSFSTGFFRRLEERKIASTSMFFFLQFKIRWWNLKRSLIFTRNPADFFVDIFRTLTTL